MKDWEVMDGFSEDHGFLESHREDLRARRVGDENVAEDFGDDGKWELGQRSGGAFGRTSCKP